MSFWAFMLADLGAAALVGSLALVLCWAIDRKMK